MNSPTRGDTGLRDIVIMIQGGNQSSYKILDCCEVFDLCLQALKYSSKSHPGGDHRHEKMRDSSDVTPPCKMLRRSDSPENKHIDSTGHSRAKAVHTHRARDRDGGERVVIETIMGLDSKLHYASSTLKHCSCILHSCYPQI